MKSKMRVNWGGLRSLIPSGEIVAIVSTMCTAFGAVGGVFYYIDSSGPAMERPVLKNTQTVTGDPGSYRISGPDQVVTKQGDYYYTFNFKARQVLIEKKDDIDPINFKAFDNDEMVEDVRAKGCAIGKDYLVAADKFIAAEPDHANSVKEDRAQAGAYVATHCKPAQLGSGL